jgi:hypothetical protein
MLSQNISQIFVKTSSNFGSKAFPSSISAPLATRYASTLQKNELSELADGNKQVKRRSSLTPVSLPSTQI